jgi:hypothetical protein
MHKIEPNYPKIAEAFAKMLPQDRALFLKTYHMDCLGDFEKYPDLALLDPLKRGCRWADAPTPEALHEAAIRMGRPLDRPADNLDPDERIAMYEDLGRTVRPPDEEPSRATEHEPREVDRRAEPITVVPRVGDTVAEGFAILLGLPPSVMPSIGQVVDYVDAHPHAKIATAAAIATVAKAVPRLSAAKLKEIYEYGTQDDEAKDDGRTDDDRPSPGTGQGDDEIDGARPTTEDDAGDRSAGGGAPTEDSRDEDPETSSNESEDDHSPAGEEEPIGAEAMEEDEQSAEAPRIAPDEPAQTASIVVELLVKRCDGCTLSTHFRGPIPVDVGIKVMNLLTLGDVQ